MFSKQQFDKSFHVFYFPKRQAFDKSNLLLDPASVKQAGNIFIKAFKK